MLLLQSLEWVIQCESCNRKPTFGRPRCGLLISALRSGARRPTRSFRPIGRGTRQLAEEAFKKVEEAHRTLSDPRMRKEYELTLPDDGGGATRRAGRQHYGYKWD